MKRQEVVNQLVGLRRELETDGALDITRALLLSDVCDALGLDAVEREAVLGWDVARTIDKWQLTQVWPVEGKESITKKGENVMTADQLEQVYTAIYERGATDETTIASATGFSAELVSEALDKLQGAGLVAQTNVAEMRYRTATPTT